jgi:hypothetical protein
MKYLIYCIFHTPKHQKSAVPLGVDDLSVALVSNNGLTAAISGITQPNLLPNVSRILTYKQVVEFFHIDRTVIPMRYGCMLNAKQQVIRLLEEHGGQYGRLLDTIKGCVEMGILVLIADCRLSERSVDADLSGKIVGAKRRSRFIGEDLRNSELENSHPQSAIRNPHSHISGKAYLSARETHYDREDQMDKEIGTVLDHFRRAFSGLYIRFKSEFQNHLLSLFFLVPRDAVEHFRQVFLNISQDAAAKLLLSGPWPPYNFVIPESKVQGSMFNVQG